MKYLIFENDLEKIKLYDECGVDRIVIDLEIIGKVERQGHLDTVISRHSLEDVKKARSVIKNSELVVRINPWGEHSPAEINNVIALGADTLMLPMFKTAEEVSHFLSFTNKRVKNILLLEHCDAVENLSTILKLKGIDEFHIGLNDLHLSYGLTFMFELWSNGTVDLLAQKIQDRSIPFGVGGVASLNEGIIPGYHVIREHARAGSSGVILSRAFTNGLIDRESFSLAFNDMKKAYLEATHFSTEKHQENHNIFSKLVTDFVERKNNV